MNRNVKIRLKDILGEEGKQAFLETSEGYKKLVQAVENAIAMTKGVTIAHKDIMLLKNLQYSLDDVVALFDESDNTKVRTSSKVK